MDYFEQLEKNVVVIIQGRKREAFDLAFQLIALDECVWDKEHRKDVFKCNGYRLNDNRLFLSRYSDKAVRFPYDFNLEQTINFAWGWWQANPEPTERHPDTDGSIEVGWRVTTEMCGVGSDDWGMFAMVEPIWFVYGK